MQTIPRDDLRKDVQLTTIRQCSLQVGNMKGGGAWCLIIFLSQNKNKDWGYNEFTIWDGGVWKVMFYSNSLVDMLFLNAFHI